MYKWAPGDLLFNGKYRVLEVLGGSMGSVYVVENCRHEKDQRPKVMVAKTLRPDLADIPMLRRRFHEEATLWVNLYPSEHIVRAFYCDYFLDVPYVFAEYVQPGIFPNTLTQWIAGYLTPPTIALYVLSSLVNALEQAQNGGIRVHGDLKPSNVLIDKTGCVKVADWGLSRPSDSQGPRLEVVANRMNPDAKPPDSLPARGTSGYAAPESLESTFEPSPAADVYSIGVIFGEMLTRKRFSHQTDASTIRSELEHSYPYRSDEVTVLTESLLALLQHQPEVRARQFDATTDRLMNLFVSLTGFERKTSSITIRPIDHQWLGQVMYSNTQLGENSRALEAAKRIQRISAKERNEKEAGSLILNIDDGTVIASANFAESFEREVAEDPLDAKKRLTLAHTYSFIGKHAEAEFEYLKVLELESLNEEALAGLVSVAKAMGRSEQALARSYTLATNPPQTAKKWLDHARVCQELGDMHGTRAACELGAKLGELDADALSYWGTALLGLGETERALEVFEEALRKDPNSGLAYYNRGVIRHGLGQIAQSLEDFEKAIEHEGPVGTAWNRIAGIHMSNGQIFEAIAALEKASEHSPDNPKVWFNLGQCMLAVGRKDDAIRYVDIALSIDPNYRLAQEAKLSLEE